MSILPKLLRQSGRDEVVPAPTNPEIQAVPGGEVEKNGTVTCDNVPADGGDEKDIVPSEDAQRGVQKIEAVTLAWTKRSLVALLVKYVSCPWRLPCLCFYPRCVCFCPLANNFPTSIWLIFLVNGLRLSILSSLTPYVTSDFESHSLLTVIGIVSNAMTSAVYIPMAKLLDIWGRAEGFLLMVGFSILGVILMATSHNLATFCAAQVSQKDA